MRFSAETVPHYDRDTADQGVSEREEGPCGSFWFVRPAPTACDGVGKYQSGFSGAGPGRLALAE